MSTSMPTSSVFFAPGEPSGQRCAGCGVVTAASSAAASCLSCGGLLEVIHPHPMDLDGHPLTGAALRSRFTRHCCVQPGGSPSGVWRYQSLIMPDASAAVVSHPEGNTPLLHRRALDQFVGLQGVRLKHEGHNPTGSFKDRGMTVAVTQAVRVGARAVACASTGNTSASLAAYAAQAGLPGLVFVPAGKIAMGKLAQTLGYGARTLMVRGDFDACLRLVQEASEALGIYLVNSINPWRIEGQKSIVFELLQQLDWQVPDFLVLPAGNLGNTAAFGKALREAMALGLIDRMPRLVSVQAAGAAPFAAGFADGFRTRHVVEADTIATAIRIGDPASWDRAVQAIAQTNGLVLACTDEEILAAKRVIDAAGIGCEPASAASVAGVRRLVEDGIIPSGAQVVAVLTGHILKDPGILVDQHAVGQPGANAPVEIDADVAAVARVLEADRQRLGASS